MTETLIDPDCKASKHASCFGGPCECSCHPPHPVTSPDRDTHDPVAERLACISDAPPAHYSDCDRFEVYNYGTRQGSCDCTASADAEALLAFTRDVLAQCDRVEAEYGSLGNLSVETIRRFAARRLAETIQQEDQ